MQDKNIVETIEEPLGDDTIKEYLPNPKIITNCDLNKIDDINQLFNKNDFVGYTIILFCDDETKKKGHWTALLKYGTEGNGIIEFFDSYGGSPQAVYDYVDKSVRDKIGTGEYKLCELLDKCNYDVIYNPIKYQADTNKQINVNTCGRHVCLRILSLIGKGYTLDQYYDWLSNAKKHYNEPYDIIASKLITL